MAESITEAGILERIIKVVVEQMNVKPEVVTLEASYEELGADSLASMELVMAFETEFGMEISDEESQELKTVKATLEYLMRNQDRIDRKTV